jgi:hypothetical protein
MFKKLLMVSSLLLTSTTAYAQGRKPFEIAGIRSTDTFEQIQSRCIHTERSTKNNNPQCVVETTIGNQPTYLMFEFDHRGMVDVITYTKEPVDNSGIEAALNKEFEFWDSIEYEYVRGDTITLCRWKFEDGILSLMSKGPDGVEMLMFTRKDKAEKMNIWYSPND